VALSLVSIFMRIVPTGSERYEGVLISKAYDSKNGICQMVKIRKYIPLSTAPCLYQHYEMTLHYGKQVWMTVYHYA